MKHFKQTIKSEHKVMSRRSFLGLSSAGLVTLLGLGLLSHGQNLSENETQVWVDDEEEECDEKSEKLIIGELCAHIACAISLSAIGEDYDQVLKDLKLYGTTPGLYTFDDNGCIHTHLHDNAAWVADHAGCSGNGYIFGYGIDEMPNPALPHANAYIDWQCGKGILPEYGTYIDPRGDIWLDAYRGIVKPEYEDIVKMNEKNIRECYATFCSCGAVPLNIHYAVGLHPDKSGLWEYFRRTYVPSSPGGWGDSMSLQEALPSGEADCGEYTIYAYDTNLGWDAMCKPGDILCKAHGTDDSHWAIYVGNDIARRYFPNTTGNVVQAGVPDRFAGVSFWGHPKSEQWYFICRPKSDIEPELRQDLPPLQLNHGCKEPCRELTLGEKIAHTACGISLTAVDQMDYNAMLKNLKLYMPSPGKAGFYDFDDGRRLHSGTMKDPEWLAQQDAAMVADWKNTYSCACYFDDVAPSLLIPNAQNYIDFVMAKDVLLEYGTYVPEPIVRNPEYKDIVAKNKRNIPGYSQFCMCGSVPEHLHWTYGLDVKNAWQAYGGISVDSLTHDPRQGLTSTGVRWEATGAPGYVVYFPDHIYGKGSPLVSLNGEYQVWSVDPEKRWIDQCQPGDMLTVEHAYWGDGVNDDAYQPADYKQVAHCCHLCVFVGNDIVRQYFPDSNGVIVEAGAGPDHFCGVTGDTEDLAPVGYKIFRPIEKSDYEIRQWVPAYKRGLGCEA